jgi:hypothetical protein
MSLKWEPLDEDAYQALTLREKIRHHRIMATGAATQAGPQWRDGAPVRADQMGDDWRRCRARAANHLQEVDRLTKRLEEYRGQAA